MPQVFTFEASIAETDERLKLWVDHSLIIDRWETYDYLSATIFSATIGLMRPNYYEVKFEYKQYAGSFAKAVLKWDCGIPGTACQVKTIVPSSNLFRMRQAIDSPFPPFTVYPAPTCAAQSSINGIGLSTSTAGVQQALTIQAVDEYGNERHIGGDNFVVRAIPFNMWDSMEPFGNNRRLQDCTGCPHTIYGSVTDNGDASYIATYNGTKRGSYKVLASLALNSGLFATYYAGSTYTGTSWKSSFNRFGQVGDSYQDFPSPCIQRVSKVGVPPSTFECASPGYDFTDTNVEFLGSVTAATTTTISAAGPNISTTDGFYVGMNLVITKGPGYGNYRRIVGFVGSTSLITVAVPFSETPTTLSTFKVTFQRFVMETLPPAPPSYP